MDHLNVFNKIITQLLSIEVKIEDEDKVVLLLASLSSTFDTLVTTLLIGRETVSVDEVTAVLFQTEAFRKPGNSSHSEGLVATGDQQCGRGTDRGSGNRRSSRSKSKGKSTGKFKCFYCQQEGHMKRDCLQRNPDLEEYKKRGKPQDSDQTSVAQGVLEDDGHSLHST